MRSQKAPLISIIIPSLNEEKFIGDCLSSLFSQDTELPFEVIVVDNGSTDNTIKVTSRWKDVRIFFEKKKGVTCARNTGSKHAQGDILYFLDADCRLPPGALKKIIDSFEKSSELDVLSGPYIYDKDGFFPQLFTDTFRYFSLYHSLFKLLTGVHQFPGGNIIIKKELFERMQGFDEHIHDINIPEDLDLAIRLHEISGVQIIFDRKYAVYSSFRRVARSPIDTFIRTRAMYERVKRKK